MLMAFPQSVAFTLALLYGCLKTSISCNYSQSDIDTSAIIPFVVLKAELIWRETDFSMSSNPLMLSRMAALRASHFLRHNCFTFEAAI